MKHLLLRAGILTLLFIAPYATYPQAALTSNFYWQQQTDYKIDVALNDQSQELSGFITIDYKNNSPQTLDFIYFHLWPNAYKDQSTPLAKQLLENGKTAFWYSKATQRGYMDSLNFKANAEVCKWQYEPATFEICKVYLNHPLKSGESVRISTPFHVNLPETFSRMGHVGQSYQITQWYPKPAVYDINGWHPMPYLDQGEFYSEFGSFDVSITLPQNYVVGATGDLQDSSEIKWMDSIAAATKKITDWKSMRDLSFPKSSARMKTLHYRQNNIHDFGWFADKRYHILKGEVELPTKRKVTTWSLFTNNQAGLWQKAPEYLHDAIYYYSLWVGEYPYEQVTAVDGTISAGGGMEYPNVTVIGEEGSDFLLDDVITHEVGHNWFYGILGSNERDHAWMDEGINSYYEYRYLKLKYPKEKMISSISPSLAKFLDVHRYKHRYQMDFAYQFMARENLDQAIDQPSKDFTELNYAVSVYGKSMLAFSYLEAYLGTALFDKAMKKYFEEWKYKHPQPENVKEVLETETGKMLDWFFDDLLQSTKKTDYKIKRSKKQNDSIQVTIKNVNRIHSPVSVSLLKKDSIVATAWSDGFEGSKTISLPSIDADKIQIDAESVIPEVNRKNNTYKLNRLAHKFERLKFQFLGSIENQDRIQIFYTPYVGWNNYDKTQVGLAIYGPFVPTRKFNYLLAPAFGTGSKQFIGYGKLNYNFFPEKVQRITIGVKCKRYSYLLFPKSLLFNKLQPFVSIELKKKNARSPFTHTFNYRTALIWQNWFNPNIAFEYNNKIKSTQFYYANELQYKLQRKTTLHPFDVSITLQQGKNFMELWAEGHFKISYRQRNQGMYIRLFAGGFPLYQKNSSDLSAPLPRLYLSYDNNSNYDKKEVINYWIQRDYMYDENFIDRNGTDKYLGRQVAITGGGFRSLTNNVGRTNKFLASVNLSSSILRFFPINPFVSGAVFIDDFNKPNLAAELGLSAVIVRDMLEIHLPLVTTKNISASQNVIGITKWYQKFTFTLKIKLERPASLVSQLAGL